MYMLRLQKGRKGLTSDLSLCMLVMNFSSKVAAYTLAPILSTSLWSEILKDIYCEKFSPRPGSEAGYSELWHSVESVL